MENKTLEDINLSLQKNNTLEILDKHSPNYSGGPGDSIAHNLHGQKVDNKREADTNLGEIKSQARNSSSKVTLFACGKKEIHTIVGKQYLIETYGTSHKDFNSNNSNIKIKDGFLYLSHLNKALYKVSLKELEEIFYAKLSSLLFYDYDKISPRKFKIRVVTYYTDLRFENFLSMLMDGKISICFDIGGKNENHDHGLRFRINGRDDIRKLTKNKKGKNIFKKYD